MWVNKLFVYGVFDRFFGQVLCKASLESFRGDFEAMQHGRIGVVLCRLTFGGGT